MKSVDVTKPVMEKVVRFEKRRSFWWIGRFFIILLVLCSAGLWLSWIAAEQIAERQTLELLTLFTQDREIISEFWQDTLTIFWEELPQGKLIIIGVLLLLIIMLILLTKKRRMIVWKRIQQIKKYIKEDYE